MIDQLRRDFNKKLKALEDAKDLAGLKELVATQASQVATVNRRPYCDPEDMAESMANDFAEDLVKHYQDTSRAATDAALRLEAAA